MTHFYDDNESPTGYNFDGDDVIVTRGPVNWSWLVVSLLVLVLMFTNCAWTVPPPLSSRLPIKAGHVIQHFPDRLPSQQQTIRSTQDGLIRVEYLYFSATMQGRQLTHRLLGYDHQLVMQALKLSCADPYDLTVYLERYEFDRTGLLVSGPDFYGPMSKNVFDQYESSLVLVGDLPAVPRPSLYPDSTAAP